MSVNQKNLLILPVGSHQIESNLFLKVRSDGARQFVFRYQKDGKRVDKIVGSAKKMTLKEAKAKASEWRSSLLAGKEIEVPGRKPKAVEKPKRREPTFREYALRTIERIREVRQWKNEKHAKQWLSTVATYAFPEIGDMRLTEITTREILWVLRPIWKTKSETASRLRGRLESIFYYAMAEGLITSNPAQWKGVLDLRLAPPVKFKSFKHHAAMPLGELKEKFPSIVANGAVVYNAIAFGTLTATRAMEFSHAKWEEVDLEKRIWSVPPERRKDKKPFPHRVPLSRQAIQLLESIERNGEYLFPASNGKKPINQYTPGQFVRRISNETATMHGMRSTFRDWAAEKGINETVAEKCLMHAAGSSVVQAYQRSDLLEQRREVMQMWADEILPG